MKKNRELYDIPRELFRQLKLKNSKTLFLGRDDMGYNRWVSECGIVSSTRKKCLIVRSAKCEGDVKSGSLWIYKSRRSFERSELALLVLECRFVGHLQYYESDIKVEVGAFEEVDNKHILQFVMVAYAEMLKSNICQDSKQTFFRHRMGGR